MSGPRPEVVNQAPARAQDHVAELGEIVEAHADLFGVGLALLKPEGARIAAAGPGIDAPALGTHYIHPIYWDGERVLDLVVGPFLAHDVQARPGSQNGAGDRAERVREGEVAAAIPRLTAHEFERIAQHVGRVLLTVLQLTDGGPAAPTQPPIDIESEVARVKSNFLATVSHELRTPLTSVIGYAEMLLEGMAGPVRDEQREYLSTILAKSDHLLKLITSMLELGRLGRATPKVERRPVSVLHLVESAVSQLASEAERRSIALKVPCVALPSVLADEQKIRQVLLHLIANAVKFTPRGGDVVIDTAIGPLAAGEEEGTGGLEHPDDLARFGVRVSIRDTGIGINPMAQARVFEPFFQADQSSTREYGGSGLGLSLAKSYVEAHGGTIWVDSRPGEGSTFTLSLPTDPEELAAFIGPLPAAR